MEESETKGETSARPGDETLIFLACRLPGRMRDNFRLVIRDGMVPAANLAMAAVPR
jgi:hypothetical protein